jgi:pimeloyl-ACP methyl ester carboxylesterase
VSEPWVRALAAAFPRGELAAIPGGHHALPRTAPAQTARAILTFLKRQGLAR